MRYRIKVKRAYFKPWFREVALYRGWFKVSCLPVWVWEVDPEIIENKRYLLWSEFTDDGIGGDEGYE